MKIFNAINKTLSFSTSVIIDDNSTAQAMIHEFLVIKSCVHFLLAFEFNIFKSSSFIRTHEWIFLS